MVMPHMQKRGAKPEYFDKARKGATEHSRPGKEYDPYFKQGKHGVSEHSHHGMSHKAYMGDSQKDYGLGCTSSHDVAGNKSVHGSPRMGKAFTAHVKGY